MKKPLDEPRKTTRNRQTGHRVTLVTNRHATPTPRAEPCPTHRRKPHHQQTPKRTHQAPTSILTQTASTESIFCSKRSPARYDARVSASPTSKPATREQELADRFLDQFPGWAGWLAQSSVAAYRQEIGKYLITAETNRFKPWQITGRKVIQHIDRLATLPGTHGRPTSPSTVVKAVAALNRLVTFKRDVQPDLPVVVTQAVKNRLIEYEVTYSQQGFAAVEAQEIPLRHLLDMERAIDRSTLFGMRNACAFTLAIGMGCRSSELVGISIHPEGFRSDLRPVNADGDIPVWVPRAKNDRTGAGRLCYVERNDVFDELCPHLALEDYREALARHKHVEGPLFISMPGVRRPDTWPRKVKRWSRSAFSGWVSKLAVDAGLPPGRYSAHSLRRTAIRVMRRGGIELDVIADHVGHKQVETTRRYTGTVAYEQASPMSDGMAHAARREGL
jgi:integrase